MSLPLHGRTTRLILAALVKLSEGRNIIFVAYPRVEAVRICRRAVAIAKGLKIPCRNACRSANGNSMDADAPWIRPREFGAEVPMPPSNAEVFIDHSACFERGSARPPSDCVIVDPTATATTSAPNATTLT